jgi:cytochrome c556
MTLFNRRTAWPLLLCLALSGTALAHSGASGIVGERMEAMESIADAMKAVGNMIRGKSHFDPKLAEDAATAIEVHASEIPQLFPEGTDQAPSEALPAIWDDWEQFTAMAGELREEAASLSQEAETGEKAEDLAARFAQLAQTCTNCHEQFRQPN